jgi:hypothetical protein
MVAGGEVVLSLKSKVLSQEVGKFGSPKNRKSGNLEDVQKGGNLEPKVLSREGFAGTESDIGCLRVLCERP